MSLSLGLGQKTTLDSFIPLPIERRLKNGVGIVGLLGDSSKTVNLRTKIRNLSISSFELSRLDSFLFLQTRIFKSDPAKSSTLICFKLQIFQTDLNQLESSNQNCFTSNFLI